MIRTLAEVHADRVTVTVTLDTEASPRRLYTDEEVADLQTSEAKLVVAPLEKALAESRELVDFKTRVADEIERDLIKAREATGLALNERNRLARRVAELERSLGDSVNRENRLETERADLEESHRRSLAARDRLLESATRRASAARDLLTAGAVVEARENIVTSRGAVLADAIGNALRVLDPA